MSKISRIYLGQSKVSPGDTKLLAELYGASPELTTVLVDLARNLGQKGDWTGYRGVYRESVRMLVDLEQASSRIHLVQSEIVPGLLQTENYVRALTEAPSPFGASPNADDVAQTRHERQKIVTRDGNPPVLSFILSESALRREYGGRDVMREQMQRLLDIARLPNVQLQVLPFASTSPVTYAWLNFALLHVPGPGIASPLNFAYVEQFDDARYLDERERVDAYERLWSNLQAAALNPVESTDFIAGVADEYLPTEAFEGAGWQKSTASAPEQGCVEFAKVGNIVAIRDSKITDGSILQFNEQEVKAMFSGVKNGEFDHFFSALLTRSSEREETS